MTQTCLPSTRPCPVTTPSAGVFSGSTTWLPRMGCWWASRPNSTNEPRSKSRSIRSRTVSLPRSCWRAIRSGPPIRRLAALRRRSSSTCATNSSVTRRIVWARGATSRPPAAGSRRPAPRSPSPGRVSSCSLDTFGRCRRMPAARPRQVPSVIAVPGPSREGGDGAWRRPARTGVTGVAGTARTEGENVRLAPRRPGGSGAAGRPPPGRSGRDQVLALSPELEQPVVAAPRPPLPLLLVQRLPEPVLVPLHRQPGHGDGPAAEPVPQLEAELEVGQPVEAELAVEAAGVQRLPPPEREHVSLQRVHHRSGGGRAGGIRARVPAAAGAGRRRLRPQVPLLPAGRLRALLQAAGPVRRPGRRRARAAGGAARAQALGGAGRGGAGAAVAAQLLPAARALGKARGPDHALSAREAAFRPRQNRQGVGAPA